MIGNILTKLSPTSLVGYIVALGLAYHIFIRARYEYRFRRAGGVNAPKIANNPFTGILWLWTLGKAQGNNRIKELFVDVFNRHATPESSNIVEVNPIGNQRFIYTQEPTHLKAVLTGKFADYGKGQDFHSAWEPFLGDSVFTTDHQKWHDSRSLIRPMLTKSRVSDLHTFEKWTSIMMDNFEPNGETTDLQDLLYRMTIDVITEYLLGESVGSLQNARSEFVEAFTTVQRWQMLITFMLPVEKFLPKGEYLRGIKVLEAFIYPFIERTLALSPSELENINKSEAEFTFLHAMAAYTRDPKVIRDQLVAVLLAGRDTTAATLSWALYELSRNTEIWTRLRSEVLSVVGPDRQPTYEDIKSLKYVSNILNETLRLYPAVPINARFALTDSSLPNLNPALPDITVVKGDAIFWPTTLMHLREDLYPAPSPDFAPVSAFSPERWEKWQPVAWQYLPFQGGPRICPGQNFAMTEMAYVLIRMAQRFERMEYRGEGVQQVKVEIVGTPAVPVKMAFWEAKI